MAKPLIWAGRGIRLSGLVEKFRVYAETTPFVTTWGAADLAPTDHPNNVGIVGLMGQPGANQAVKECDNLCVWGSSLSPTQMPPERPHDFRLYSNSSVEWLERVKQLKELNRIPDEFSSHWFNRHMTQMLPVGSMMVVDGGGTALYTGFQASVVKEGSRLICSTAISAMGSGLPESVGACLASGRLTTCLVGDGSFMLNLQELATIQALDLGIKVFVLNNSGYLAIRHTQDSYLEGRFFGTQFPDIDFPSTQKIAEAFRIPYFYVDGKDCEETLEEVLFSDGPAICEVICPSSQKMLWT